MQVIPIEPKQNELASEFAAKIEELRKWLHSTTGEDSNQALAQTLGVNRQWIEKRLRRQNTVKILDIFAIRYALNAWERAESPITPRGAEVAFRDCLYLQLINPQQKTLSD